MKKIIVIGCPGSGKTTFSIKLNKLLGLPLYHLDAIWHKPDKTHISREQFDERIKDIFATDEWIIDGNYNRTIEMRLQQCDTVFLFDLPTEVCLQGAIDRVGKSHCDLPWIETEPDAEFLESISNFPNEVLPGIYNLLDKYKNDKNIVIFKSRAEADKFINKLSNSVIEQLMPDDYCKCSNIWNMESQPLADKWLEEIKSGNRIVFVYKINGDFIGEGALVFDTSDPDYTVPKSRVYVSRMIVKKEYRNKGIGSEILEFLISESREMGFSEMTVGVDKDNANALHLYNKYGFTKVLFDGADEQGEYLKLMKYI